MDPLHKVRADRLCRQFVGKTFIPVLPRSNKNPDDIDKASEDRIFDAVKYMVAADRSPHVCFERRQAWGPGR